jgi:hypothetical protein
MFLAMYIYKRDWKHVESYIGTRSGAQIRSHAQKFFTKVEKEHPGKDFDEYIMERAKILLAAKAGEAIPHNEMSDGNCSITEEVKKSGHNPQIDVKSDQVTHSQKHATRLRTASTSQMNGPIGTSDDVSTQLPARSD